MKLTFSEDEQNNLLGSLSNANLKFQNIYPGDKPDRQAVHTVYGGANLFKSDTCVKMGDIALRNLKTYAHDFVALARVLKFKGYEDLPVTEKKIKKLINKLDSISEAERKKKPGVQK